MGKRFESTEKRPRDYWPTIDPDAIVPAFRKEIEGKTYAEPCYGLGHLENLIGDVATCVWRSDLLSIIDESRQLDALKLTKECLHNSSLIITNPPYSWESLQPLLDHLPYLKPTWFLLPADFMHNKRSGVYMKKCAKIISVGRLAWVENQEKKIKGKDNFCWYRFQTQWDYPTQFIGRDYG